MAPVILVVYLAGVIACFARLGWCDGSGVCLLWTVGLATLIGIVAGICYGSQEKFWT